MDNRLKNLRNAMKKTVLRDIQFTEQHKGSIRRKVNQLSTNSEEEVILAIFQLLKEKRTGFALSRLLRARGMGKFETEEGYLYMFLHKFEHKGYLRTYWNEPDVKYYQLNTKGLKLLKNLEKESSKAYCLKEILEW
ncbi:PadR family transcriptional regulator [Niallia sp. BSM11]|uniref:PadR family transcriptional regulator n=1 Tax=Niallia sp. BSM11 TaxID=3391576 RepID=UPI003984F894